MMKKGKWLTRLKQLDGRTSDQYLDKRIYDMLKRTGGYTQDKAEEYKEETELFKEILLAQSEFIELNGEFNDMFGHYLMETEQLNKRAGQFFTPMNLVRMMTKMTYSDDKEKLGEKVWTILDPCSGAGRFMLGAAEHFKNILGYYNFLFTNIDIDKRMYTYTVMNAIIHAVPSVTIWGDTLAEKYWEGVAVIPAQTGLRWAFMTVEQCYNFMPKTPRPKRGMEKFMDLKHPVRVTTAEYREVPKKKVKVKKKQQSTLF
jgi:type I restriction-modification system DNA methylase subunit